MHFPQLPCASRLRLSRYGCSEPGRVPTLHACRWKYLPSFTTDWSLILSLRAKQPASNHFPRDCSAPVTGGWARKSASHPTTRKTRVSGAPTSPQRMPTLRLTGALSLEITKRLLECRLHDCRTANYPGSSKCQICVGLTRLRLAGKMIKRPQATRTYYQVCQPPHRIVDSAFHWALLLRIDRIANYTLRMNRENTELQKIICELKKIAGEWPKV